MLGLGLVKFNYNGLHESKENNSYIKHCFLGASHAEQGLIKLILKFKQYTIIKHEYNQGYIWFMNLY